MDLRVPYGEMLVPSGGGDAPLAAASLPEEAPWSTSIGSACIKTIII